MSRAWRGYRRALAMLVTVSLSVASAGPGFAEEPTSKVTFVSKDGRAEGGKKAGPLAAGAQVAAGQRVATGAASQLGLQAPTGGEIVLNEQSMVRVRDGATTPTKAPVDFTLMSGSLRASSPPGQPVVVLSAISFAYITVEGEAVISVDDKGTTRVAVSRGRADLTAWKRSTSIDAGFGSKVEKGWPPKEANPLPAAPKWKRAPEPYTWLPGPEGAEFASEYASAVVPAEWHVQFARDAAFTNVISDERIPGTTTALSKKGLGVGTYFARASAIDADRYEGAFGPAASTSVIEVVWQLQPGHIAVGEVRPKPPEAQCGLDDAPLLPIKGPIRVEAWGGHELHCKATKDGSVAKIAVLKDPLGPIGLSAKWLDLNLEQRSGEVVVRLTDDVGEQLATRSLKIVSDSPHVVVTDVDPANERGRYFVKVRWKETHAPFRLKGSLGDSPALSNALFMKEPPPPPPEDDSYDLAMSLGAGLVAPQTDSPLIGGRVTVNPSYWTPAGPGAFGVGFRAGFEEYFLADAQVTSPRNPESVGLQVRHEVLSLALTLGYRLGVHSAGRRPLLVPYFLAEPMVAFQNVQSERPIYGSRRAGNGLLGIGATLGLNFRVGASSAIFVEASARTTTALGTTRDVVQDGGYFGSLGYRFDL